MKQMQTTVNQKEMISFGTLVLGAGTIYKLGCF